MAQVGALVIPPDLLAAWNKLFCISDNRVHGAVRKIGYLPTRQKTLSLTTRSLLPQIRDYYKGLTINDINAWKAAGAVSSMSGWNLFTQDTAYRIKYGIAGLATPSLLHQYKVGRIEIAAPANKVILAQYHPILYYVSKKLPGKTTVREDVAITEKLVLPLTIGVSYRSNLAPTGAGSKARFYAIIYSSYQGRTIETEVGFNFNTQTGWTSATATSTEVIGVARYYNLYIELDGYTGFLEWDNVISTHTGTNYARDRKCMDVNNELTRVNFQIEKSWEETFLPSHAAFDSVYPAD
jgi:hypothetical protein